VVVADPDRAGIRTSRATWGLGAAPLPVTACLICPGVYSWSSIPNEAAAHTRTPLAWPTAIAVATLRLK
jgi:hypothetical protein